MGTLSTLWQLASAGDATERPFECRGCGTTFSEQRQVCPDCGSYTIDRREW
jgi:rRNA maturation endonuclease Nob1